LHSSLRNRVFIAVMTCLLLWMAGYVGVCQQNVSILFTGDVMLDRGIRKEISRIGIKRIFMPISRLLQQSNFVVVNLECPATKTSAPQKKGFVFRAEPEWLRELRAAHISHLNLANNHSIDQGSQGLASTVDSLLRVGIVPVGCGVEGLNECDPTVLTTAAGRIVLFSSVQLSLEGWKGSPGKYAPCQSTVEELCRKIRSYKKSHPGDVVVVCLHWGVEYHISPAKFQRVQAHHLIDSGADALIGHHPHVFQVVEIYRGRPIFYSLGNLLFDQRDSLTRKGAVVGFLIRSGRIDSTELYPVVLKHGIPFWARPDESAFLRAALPSDDRTIHVRYSE